MTASSWIATWASLAPASATVLDIAAGKGRHTRFFAERGHRVTAVDRDVSGLATADTIKSSRPTSRTVRPGRWPVESSVRWS